MWLPKGTCQQQLSNDSPLAEEHRLDPSIATKTINMVNLSPKIQRQIVKANTPQSINREKLFGAIPDAWEEQERGGVD